MQNSGSTSDFFLYAKLARHHYLRSGKARPRVRMLWMKNRSAPRVLTAAIRSAAVVADDNNAKFDESTGCPELDVEDEF